MTAAALNNFGLVLKHAIASWLGAFRDGWARLSRRVPVILQSETTECGLACICMVAGFYGGRLTIADLRERFPISLRGMTLRQAIQIASELGLKARAVRCEPEDLDRLTLPAMLHWDLQHFVVLVDIGSAGYRINDPGRGEMTLRRAELGRHFTGIALDFSQVRSFAEPAKAARLTIRSLVGPIPGIGRSALLILGLSFFAEIFLLTQPLLLRYMIDFAFDNRDGGLALRLAGVGTLAAISAAAVIYARDKGAMNVAARVNMTMAQRLFSHSLSLPIGYFEKRLTGDLVDRYRSIEAIERYLTGELPTVILDGFFTIVSLSILLLIAPWVGLATLGMFLLYLSYRLLGARRLKSAEAASIFARAHESGYLIETLQQVLSIKVRSNEVERQSVWLSRFAEYVEKQHELGTLQARQRSAKTLIGGLDLVLFTLIAFLQFQSGGLGLGGLFAILFYKGHFFTRSTGLVERLIIFRMLGVQLDRLEDIVQARPEATGSVPATGAGDTAHPALAFRDVSFRYSEFDPVIITSASFELEQGAFALLVGPSGAGKTTLLKLALGLYVPIGGEIRCHGVSTTEISLSAHRRRFGVVMQDDQLLVGTVAENVSFFAADVDMDRVEWACGQACIADEVERMPMGYMTSIGGNAGGLSGGQKQRLMIARALYHDVEILLLDEGTANLDPASELRVLANVKKLGITTLMIAHGSTPISLADQLLRLDQDGRIGVDESFLGSGIAGEERVGETAAG